MKLIFACCSIFFISCSTPNLKKEGKDEEPLVFEKMAVDTSIITQKVKSFYPDDKYGFATCYIEDIELTGDEYPECFFLKEWRMRRCLKGMHQFLMAQLQNKFILIL